MAITAEDLPDEEAARIGRDAIATKADVANLRADIQKDIGNLSWKVVAVIAADVAILGLMQGLILKFA